MAEIKDMDQTKPVDELLDNYAKFFKEFAPKDPSSASSVRFEIFSMYQPVELSYSAVTER